MKFSDLIGGKGREKRPAPPPEHPEESAHPAPPQAAVPRGGPAAADKTAAEQPAPARPVPEPDRKQAKPAAVPVPEPANPQEAGPVPVPRAEAPPSAGSRASQAAPVEPEVRKSGPALRPASPQTSVESAPAAPERILPPVSKPEPRRKEEAPVQKRQKPFRELDAEAKELYSKNISTAAGLLARVDQAYLEIYEKIMRLAALNLRALGENPAFMSYTAHATAGNYLHAHSANVAIISQAMGHALRLDGSAVHFLGFCAMAHDIGMTGFIDLAGKEERLSDEEFSEITLHSGAGAEKAERIIDMDYKAKERAVKVISQVHERTDSSGYPQRLPGGEIDLLAQIIGVADVYEAMSHPRSWREAYHPHNAVKYLIDQEGRCFDTKIVKALMASVTLYPPGSLVALSTGEIARVAGANPGSLTRPAVETLLDAGFNAVLPQTVDLLEYPLTAIGRIVELDEIARKNPKFAAKLEMARWWVEW